jgi:exodeoxyribonuclease VII large subunit
LIHRTERALSGQLQLQGSQLSGLYHRLEALNPVAILKRGYAVVSDPDGTIIRSTKQVHQGDQVTIRVSDGDFSANVTGG